jgi:hypothetical protein
VKRVRKKYRSRGSCRPEWAYGIRERERSDARGSGLCASSSAREMHASDQCERDEPAGRARETRENFVAGFNTELRHWVTRDIFRVVLLSRRNFLV